MKLLVVAYDTDGRAGHRATLKSKAQHIKRLMFPSLLTVTGSLVEGFRMYRDQVRDQLDADVTVVPAADLREIRRVLSAYSSDAALISVHWSAPVAEVETLFQEAREDDPARALGFLDFCDQTSSPHFSVLPYVDVYVKRQVLKDRALYRSDLAGGYIFTDFLSRKLGYELKDWYFGSTLGKGSEDRLVTGWNLGVQAYFHWLAKRSVRNVRAWDERDIEINIRFGLSDSARNAVEWYQEYRVWALDRLERLGDTHRVSGTKRLPRRKYIDELRRSRIVFSPFGWGEVCFRDFEAVCCGALLMKPSMEHLETSPDIFVANETYVRVKWDMSDVEEKCRYYIDHPQEAERIAKEASARVREYFDQGGFVADLRRVVDRLAAARA